MSYEGVRLCACIKTCSECEAKGYYEFYDPSKETKDELDEEVNEILNQVYDES